MTEAKMTPEPLNISGYRQEWPLILGAMSGTLIAAPRCLRPLPTICIDHDVTKAATRTPCEDLPARRPVMRLCQTLFTPEIQIDKRNLVLLPLRSRYNGHGRLHTTISLHSYSSDHTLPALTMHPTDHAYRPDIYVVIMDDQGLSKRHRQTACAIATLLSSQSRANL